jgi:hypothetical protein
VNGQYFKLEEAIWGEGSPKITSLDVQDAIEEYNQLSERTLDILDAFPDVEFREA